MTSPSVCTTTWQSRIKDTTTTTDTDMNTTTQRIMIVSWWNFAAFPLLVPFRQRRTSYAFNSPLTKGEQELPFPSVPGNESLLIPVPEIWESFFFFSFPFLSRMLGMFFSFPSSSWIMGIDFFHSVPVPEYVISPMGIITGIGILWEISDFQYIRLPLNFSHQFILKR